jgi:asparagine synthase (glutamine-hydrolysing)
VCGIAGIVNLNKRTVEPYLLEAMAEAQKHRGPDDAGIFVSGTAGLCHRRLAIIDLSKDGHQPMMNEDSSLSVVHNGEIYNYVELRTELEGLGHNFRSRSDTEVILHAYEEWGDGCLKRFNGMWSFAILDKPKGVLFCSRDRLGVKPFYYYRDNDLFVFASEIKSLLCHPGIRRAPNDKAIYDYLVSGYGYMDISDETFFSGIKQLRPAHYIRLSLDGRKFSQSRYWDIDPHKKKISGNEEDVYRDFYGLFEDSVRLRLRSDVPVGVSLSGGLDSSSIACVAAALIGPGRIEAFSSCFDEKRFDERDFIRPVLEKTGTRENLVFARPDKLFDEIDEIVWHQEEPYSTLSIFPQWYVMRLAREKGVKVLLTGQGGDEVLGGYHKYYYYLFADKICSGRWAEARDEMARHAEFRGQGGGVAGKVFKIMASHVAPQGLKTVLKGARCSPAPSYLAKDFAGHGSGRVFTEKRFSSILNNDLYNALKISPLPSLLHIDDRSSMAHSVESRAPFLDYRLVEYAFSLGPEYKIRNGVTKYVLRRAMEGVLPEKVRTRTDKMGYATPLETWFRSCLKDKVRDVINSASFRRRPYFDHSDVMARLDRFMGTGWGRGGNEHFTVWSWVNLELWMRKFIDGN